jgi:uncharacterized Zn finger protein|nr:MAG TPA: hypothetical protein [Caudoviricetes sp.]
MLAGLISEIIKCKKGPQMNTVNKIVTEISQKLANAIVEASNYKVLYEEASEENKRVNELLSKFNDVLDSDPALKDLFDEASQKLEEGK